jgi:hypothetical protein
MKICLNNGFRTILLASMTAIAASAVPLANVQTVDAQIPAPRMW